jgi:hypothetical protein
VTHRFVIKTAETVQYLSHNGCPGGDVFALCIRPQFVIILQYAKTQAKEGHLEGENKSTITLTASTALRFVDEQLGAQGGYRNTYAIEYAPMSKHCSIPASGDWGDAS